MTNKSKKIILVANAENITDINHYLAHDDLIVRFNIPKTSTLEPTGLRTDILFLANTVDILDKKLKKNGKFLKFSKKYNQQFQIIFPYSDNLIKIINPTYVKKRFFICEILNNFNNFYYIKLLNSYGFEVEILDEESYFSLQEKISSNQIISTGLIAVNYFLNNPKYFNYDLYLHGFSFEGWSGHNWSKEKEFVESLKKIRKLHTFN